MRKPESRYYEFGEFRVDVRKRLLLRQGEPVRLTLKVFQLLVALVERSGEVLDKADLMERVWPDTIVEEANLKNSISTLRKALGEERGAEGYIQTLPKRGYRFTAPVIALPDEDEIYLVEKQITAEIVIDQIHESRDITATDLHQEQLEVVGKDAIAARPAGGDAFSHAAGEAAAAIVSEARAPQLLPGKVSFRARMTRRQFAVGGGLVAVLIVIMVMAIGMYRWLNPSKAWLSPSFENLKITRLTAHGRVTAAAISPDGKYVVYAKKEAGRQSLWLRQVAVDSDTQVLPPTEREYRFLTFSPDGNFLYCIASDSGIAGWSLYQMTTLGRNPTKLFTQDIVFDLTLSPDGKRMAYVRGHSDKKNELVIANAQGKDEQVIECEGGDDFGYYLAWSPDGRRLAGGKYRKEGQRDYWAVVEISLESGAQKAMTAQRWNWVDKMEWLADGGGLIVLASESSRVADLHLWYLPYPGGEMRRLTNELNAYSSLSLTADSKALIVVQHEISFGVWVAPDGDASRAKPLPRRGNDDGTDGLTWTPDGKIVYYGSANGITGLWITDLEGNDPKSLESNVGRMPVVSADGRWLVFSPQHATSYQHIWRMELSSGELKELSNGYFDSNPSLSPDGKWVVYSSRNPSQTTLWKVAIEGGAPVQLSQPVSRFPAVSPDGKLIAYYALGEAGKRMLLIIPFEGGPPIKDFALPPAFYREAGFRWTPDGQALTYVCTRDDVSNIWSQPLAADQPKPLTNFNGEQIRAFAWSRDGQLAVSRGVVNTDVVLISGFK